MDWSLTQCNSIAVRDVDRLTSLPSELLIHILSLLPTKDVASTCIFNRRLRHVFPLITSLDFDVSPISLCLRKPYAIQHYPIFVAFVNAVLQAHQSEYLTRFRLQVSSNNFHSFFVYCQSHGPWGKRLCLPDLKSTQLNAWMSFPLNYCSLRELDLCILVREPDDAQLPPAIFTCQTLEVLKLQINIGLDNVISLPSYHLPNLRVFNLRASFVSDDGFLARLLACCPLLEDLTYGVRATTHHVSQLTIESDSLRSLVLLMTKVDEFVYDCCDFVLIHTPNLECLEYSDNIAIRYSIPMLHRLVRAKLDIFQISYSEDGDLNFQQLKKLITSVSHVQRLSLRGIFMRELYYVDVDDPKDQLPMFPNLNYLKLCCSEEAFFWNKVLLRLLNCAPVLETLVFAEGFIEAYDDFNFDGEDYKLESEFFGSVHPIHSCCRYHLRRIVIKKYLGLPREEEIVQYFLRHALVLEELLIYLHPTRQLHPASQRHRASQPLYPIPDQMLIERSLTRLPKASGDCSIQVL